MICAESSTSHKLPSAEIASYLKHAHLFMMKGEATDRPIILAEEKYAVTKLRVACCENVMHRDLRDSPAQNRSCFQGNW